MIRIVVLAMCAAMLAGCEKPDAPAVHDTAAEEAAAAELEAASGPIPLTPAEPGAAPARVAAMQLSCAGESFRVAFEDARAVVILDDGSNVELPVLPPQPNTAFVTFTDGRMTFTKEGGRDTATVIRFARGRMAFVDCAIAQH